MMKVLFVSSGNFKEGISSIIKNQGESLADQGAEIFFFTIKGKGIKGYLRTVPKLKKLLKENKYDIIHAHYSLSAYIAFLAGSKPLIVSLMGSDVNDKGYNRYVIKLFSGLFWSETIVKSDDMKESLGLKKVFVIPNGVDLKKFKPVEKSTAIKATSWDISKKHILFAADPNRPEKNFKLAKKAYDLMDSNKIELHYLNDVPNDNMINFYNSSDVILLTSFWEGSPNVIKEAMACNIPIVSTDVGDVRKIIGKTTGCYLVENNPEDVFSGIKQALHFNGKTEGRKGVSHLDSTIISSKLIGIYNSIKINK